jgi:DnaK suppressor protein
VDADTARDRLRAERAEINRMLLVSEAAVKQNLSAENEQIDADDRAQPLTAEGIDDAVEASLRDRLAALDRAERRLSNGKYGLSIRTGYRLPTSVWMPTRRQRSRLTRQMGSESFSTGSGIEASEPRLLTSTYGPYVMAPRQREPEQRHPDGKDFEQETAV